MFVLLQGGGISGGGRNELRPYIVEYIYPVPIILVCDPNTRNENVTTICCFVVFFVFI